MGCGEWTYYAPGSEPDKCGVTIVTGGEVFECNVCQIARLRAENERLTSIINEVRSSRDEVFSRAEASARAAIELDRMRIAERDEARAEIERLKRDVEHYAQAILWEGDMIVTQTRYQQVHAHIAELEAECERLRADVVFATYTETIRPTGKMEGRVRWWVHLREGSVLRWARWDGTDEDLRRAVREARNGVS